MDVIELVLTQHRTAWFWRIDVNDRTVEDCTGLYYTAEAALKDAQVAHSIHKARLSATMESR